MLNNISICLQQKRQGSGMGLTFIADMLQYAERVQIFPPFCGHVA
jgi:hypothetical protein